MSALAGFALILSLAARAQPIDAELAPVVDALYDLQLDSAAARLKELVVEHPGHPAPIFYETLIDYQRWAYDPGGAQAPSQSFEAGLAETERLAEAWIATSPIEGYYYLGAARGFSGRVLADRGHWLKAAAPGMRAIRYLRRALALEPSLIDADLGIGMYDYFRSQLPAAAKPFAFLFTFDTGNRERGLQELSLAAKSGALAKAEAQNVLAAIYSSDDEREWGMAAPLLAELTARYPHNPAYRLRWGYAELRLGHWSHAISADDPEGAWLTGLDARMRDRARALALYRSGEAALLDGRYDLAGPWLTQLAGLTAAPPLDDWLALRRANLLDAQGRREEALAAYRAVRQWQAARLARAFLATPFPDGPRDVMPWTDLELPR